MRGFDADKHPCWSVWFNAEVSHPAVLFVTVVVFITNEPSLPANLSALVPKKMPKPKGNYTLSKDMW